MKPLITTVLLGFVVSTLSAADKAADPQAAAKALGDKANYTWTTKTETTSQFREGDREGKLEKNGFAVIKMSMRDNNEIVAVVKGGKAVVKIGESWQTAASLAENDDQENRRMRFLARRLQQFKAPHTEAQDLLKNVKDLKKGDEGAYSGELTPAGLKELMARGFRRPDGGDGPDVSGLKGTVKVWVKGGVLTKFSNHVEGSMKLGDRDVEVDRTTTTEITDVGTTAVTVPEGAKDKLSG